MRRRTFKTEVKLNLAEPKLNKNNTLEEYTEQLLDENEYYNVKAICSMAFIMNDKEFVYFKNNLLKDFDFLKDVPCGYSDEDYTQDVVMIVNEETKQKFFVNTQGFNYARYCLFD
jgi:hypothetical protein